MAGNSWTTLTLSEPIELIAGDGYALSVNFDEDDNFYAATQNPTLDESFTFLGGYYDNSQDTYPNTAYDRWPLLNLVVSRETVTEGGVNIVYATIGRVESWLIPEKKTYYQEAPTGTPVEVLQDIADSIATRMSRSGIVESFNGPFRPQLQPGDTAQIVDDDGNTQLGVVTNVTHSFGKSGFTTAFSVDSGGVLAPEQITSIVDKLIKQKQVDTAARPY
jgi:hypothetical protein